MLRTSNTYQKPVVIFDNVSKEFQKGKAHSLKKTVLGALRGGTQRDSFLAVDNVTFNIFPGESVALVGKNGSGKSTALKLLSGVIRPDSGKVLTRGKVGGLLEVGAGFHPELTGRENVYLNAAILGMSRRETEKKFDEIVDFAEIGDFIDTEVKRYSSGMYARLGFSVAIHTQLDVLIVDEALSVGDKDFQLKCAEHMNKMRNNGVTMLIVTHNENQVKKLCSRAIVLSKGKVVYDGNTTDALKLNESS